MRTPDVERRRPHEPSALPVHHATKMLRSASVLGPFVDAGGTWTGTTRINVSGDGPSVVNQGACFPAISRLTNNYQLLSLNAGYWNTFRAVTSLE